MRWALDDGRVDEAGAILARARALADDEGDLIQRVLARDALAKALNAGGAELDATAIRAEAEALALTAAPILDPVERVDRLSPGTWG